MVYSPSGSSDLFLIFVLELFHFVFQVFMENFMKPPSSIEPSSSNGFKMNKSPGGFIEDLRYIFLGGELTGKPKI